MEADRMALHKVARTDLDTRDDRWFAKEWKGEADPSRHRQAHESRHGIRWHNYGKNTNRGAHRCRARRHWTTAGVLVAFITPPRNARDGHRRRLRPGQRRSRWSPKYSVRSQTRPRTWPKNLYTDEPVRTASAQMSCSRVASTQWLSRCITTGPRRAFRDSGGARSPT